MKVAKRSIVFRNLLINSCGRVVLGYIDMHKDVFSGLTDHDRDVLILFIASVLFIELPEVFSDSGVDVGLRIRVPDGLLKPDNAGDVDLRAIAMYASTRLTTSHPVLGQLDRVAFTAECTKGKSSVRILGKTAVHAVVIGTVVMLDLIRHYVTQRTGRLKSPLDPSDETLTRAYETWLGHSSNRKVLGDVYRALESFANSESCVIDDSENFIDLRLI